MYETIIEQLHYFRYKPADDNKIHAAKRVMPTGIDNYIKYRTLLFYTISGFTVLSCKGMTNTFYIVVIENILLDQVLQSEHHTLIQCSVFVHIRPCNSHIFDQAQSLQELLSQPQCALLIATFIGREPLLTFTCIT